MTSGWTLTTFSTFLASLSWLGRLFLVMTYTTMAIPMTTVWTPMTFSTFLKSLSWVGRLFTVLMWTPTMMVFPMTRPMTTTFFLPRQSTFLTSTCFITWFRFLMVKTAMVVLTYGWKAMCVDAVLAHITFIRTFIRLFGTQESFRVFHIHIEL